MRQKSWFVAWLIVLTAILNFSSFAMADAPETMHSQTIIARMWHGRTLEAKSDEYFQYLQEAGIKKIEAIDGNLGTQVFRQTENGMTDFYVISYWRSLEDIKKFAGEDITKTRFLPRDPEFLIEPEMHVRHFEVLVNDWKK